MANNYLQKTDKKSFDAVRKKPYYPRYEKFYRHVFTKYRATFWLAAWGGVDMRVKLHTD